VLQPQITQQQQFERGIRQVWDAGQGAMSLIILTPNASTTIVANAMAGDALAKIVMTAADQLLRRIHRRSRARALPCLTCDSAMLWRCEPPAAVGVLLPFGIVQVRIAIGLAVCSGCAEGHTEQEIAHSAADRLRRGCMPGLRLLPPMSVVAGHA
jgi:hypothetical protein